VFLLYFSFLVLCEHKFELTLFIDLVFCYKDMFTKTVYIFTYVVCSLEHFCREIFRMVAVVGLIDVAVVYILI